MSRHRAPFLCGTRHAGCGPRDRLEPLGCDLASAHFADPVSPLADPHQRGVDGSDLLNDLIVNRDVGEPLDGDARSLAHPLAERDAAARHIGTRAEGGGPAVEFVTKGVESINEGFPPVQVIRSRSGRLTHPVDCSGAPTDGSERATQPELERAAIRIIDEPVQHVCEWQLNPCDSLRDVMPETPGRPWPFLA